MYICMYIHVSIPEPSSHFTSGAAFSISTSTRRTKSPSKGVEKESCNRSNYYVMYYLHLYIFVAEEIMLRYIYIYLYVYIYVVVYLIYVYIYIYIYVCIYIYIIYIYTYIYIYVGISLPQRECGRRAATDPTNTCIYTCIYI
jgi:hypothetical protein